MRVFVFATAACAMMMVNAVAQARPTYYTATTDGSPGSATRWSPVVPAKYEENLGVNGTITVNNLTFRVIPTKPEHEPDIRHDAPVAFEEVWGDLIKSHADTVEDVFAAFMKAQEESWESQRTFLSTINKLRRENDEAINGIMNQQQLVDGLVNKTVAEHHALEQSMRVVGERMTDISQRLTEAARTNPIDGKYGRSIKRPVVIPRIKNIIADARARHRGELD